MRNRIRIGLVVLGAAGLFSAGYVAGQNQFGQPKTIVHISLIKWKANAPDAEKQKAIEGVKEMAAKIPGMKNIWLKPRRMQPRDYDTAFAIEFENQEAAERYAEDPVHEEWSKHFLSIREASISPQLTN